MTVWTGSQLVWHGGPIVCRPSGVKHLGLLVLCAALLSASAWCVTLPGVPQQVAGWAGLVFFGLTAVILVLRMVRGQAPVVLGPDGLDDPRLGCGPIAWEDVTALRVVSVNGTRLLCLDVADPSTYLARMSPWRRTAARANKALGFSCFTVGFVGLTPGIGEVLARCAEQLHPAEYRVRPARLYTNPGGLPLMVE